MSEWTACEKCRKPFVADEAWKRKCILCWKGDAKYELTKSDKAYGLLQDAFVALVSVRDAEKVEHDALQTKYTKLVAAYRVLKAQSTEVRDQNKSTSTDALTQDRIMQLIRLTHPDRHANSELSNDVTKWLLSLRSK